MGNLGVLLGNGFDPVTNTGDARFLTWNPFGIDALEAAFRIFIPVAFFGAIGAVVAAPFAMGLRLRRSHGDERQQLRWLASAGILVVLAIAGVIVVGRITAWESGGTAEEIGQLVVISSLALSRSPPASRS